MGAKALSNILRFSKKKQFQRPRSLGNCFFYLLVELNSSFSAPSNLKLLSSFLQLHGLLVEVLDGQGVAFQLLVLAC